MHVIPMRVALAIHGQGIFVGDCLTAYGVAMTTKPALSKLNSKEKRKTLEESLT